MWGCSGAGAPTPGTGTGDRQPFRGWSVPGLVLTRVCESLPDDSRCWVSGVDESGNPVEGASLFVRAADPAATPDVLARRAEDTLFAESGSEPLLPGSGESFATADERALITAPRVEGGRLVYFRAYGEMSPQLTQVTIDLSTGAIERIAAADLVARTAAGEPACESYAVCHCERGCRAFARVVTSAGERFRDEAGGLWYRPDVARPLRAIDETTCDETCRVGPAALHCTTTNGVCGPP